MPERICVIIELGESSRLLRAWRFAAQLPDEANSGAALRCARDEGWAPRRVCRKRLHQIRGDAPLTLSKTETCRGITAGIDLNHLHAWVDARATCRQPTKHAISRGDERLSPEVTNDLARVNPGADAMRCHEPTRTIGGCDQPFVDIGRFGAMGIDHEIDVNAGQESRSDADGHHGAAEQYRRRSIGLHSSVDDKRRWQRFRDSSP